MPVTLPPTTSALGNQTIIVLDTAPANPAAPTKAELNAGLFAQCLIYGRLNAQPSQNTGEAPRKGCSKISDQRLGLTTYPSFDVSYSYMPQDAAAAGGDGNELYDILVPDTEVYVYLAEGLDGEDTSVLATADVVNNGFKVKVGEYREGVTGDGEFDEMNVMQALVPQGGRLLHNYATPAA
jgi:hypothetical protein